MTNPPLSIRSVSATKVMINGRVLCSFAGCNYLGLAHHPRVIEALIEGALLEGISTAGSRETTGNSPAHDELEVDLSRFLYTEAALLVPSGYLANLIIAQAIAVDHQFAIVDERSHSSIKDALAAVRLPAFEYEHIDVESARRLLKYEERSQPVIFTDGVFPAFKTLAPLPELLALLPLGRGLLIVDDCHSLGVLGARGRGTCEHFALSDPRIVTTSSLSKALGCQGGVIAGSRHWIDAARKRSQAYICSTPIPPPLARAASSAVRELESDPDRLTRLRNNVARLRCAFRELGLPASDQPIPVFTFALETRTKMEELHRALLLEGLFVPLIEYPDGLGCHFRLTLCAEHSDEQIDALAAGLNAHLKHAPPSSEVHRVRSVESNR